MDTEKTQKKKHPRLKDIDKYLEEVFTFEPTELDGLKSLKSRLNDGELGVFFNVGDKFYGGKFLIHELESAVLREESIMLVEPITFVVSAVKLSHTSQKSKQAP